MAALDDYELVRVLARGGMGIVHEAVERATGRRVALKRILAGALDADAVARFLVEGRALARLDHPAVVRVHSLGQAPGGPFMVMDLVAGEPLQRRLDREGPLPVSRALTIVRALAAALAHAHAQGVLHRDLKPANVLLDERGDVRLIDFGLARLQVTGGSLAHLTRTGEVLGTPGYMAPEQADGREVDARTDVYGLGATLFALLTGRSPFEAPNAIAALHDVLMREPEAPSRLRPGVPPALDALVLACLAKDPAARPASMQALHERLDERVLVGAPRGARPWRALLAGAAAAATALLAAALVRSPSLGTTGERAPTPASGDAPAVSSSPVAAASPRDESDHASVGDLERRVAAAPDDVDLRIELARARARADDLQAALAPPPDGAPRAAWLAHAYALLAAERAEEAWRALEDRHVGASSTAVLTLSGFGRPSDTDLDASAAVVLARLRVNLVRGGSAPLVVLDQLLGARPEWVGGRFERARAYLQLNRLELFERDLTALRELGRRAQGEVARLVAARASAGPEPRLAEALGALAEAVRSTPSAPDVLTQRATVLHLRALHHPAQDAPARERDLRDAERDLTAALAHDPLLASARRLRADVRGRLGDLEGAADDLTRAAALAGEEVSLHVLRDLADLLRQLGRADEEADALERAFGCAVTVDELQGVVARLEALGRPQPDWGRRWLATFEPALGRDHSWSIALMELEAVGQRAAVDQALDRALRSAPGDPVLLALRGNVAHSRGDLDAALRWFDAGVAATPDAPSGYLLRAGAHQARGDLERARADLDRAVALAGPEERWRALAARSVLREQQGDLEGALDDARAAAALRPAAPDLRARVEELGARLRQGAER